MKKTRKLVRPHWQRVVAIKTNGNLDVWQPEGRSWGSIFFLRRKVKKGQL